MKSSGWQYNQRYRELEASHFRGIAIPSEFDKLSKEDKLDIVAHYEIHWRIQAINDYEQNQAAMKKKPKRKKMGFYFEVLKWRYHKLA